MGIYIQIYSMHGLFRGQNLELGRDEDTGGQIIYVKNLAIELGKLNGIDRVDIITRRIIDPGYPGYSQVEEKLAPKVKIIRIECGPKKYIKKVNLWPYIDEFVENCKKYIKKVGKPDILHSNYADSGYVCAKLSKSLNVPQVHTGHSLGKPKMERLGVNDKNFKAMDKIYNFSKRLEAEQLAIDNASAIIISTQEEGLYQYSMYHIDQKNIKFHIVPPGVNLNKFYPVSKKDDVSTRERLRSILEARLEEPSKPIIFSMSRLDFKKNLISLLKAYSFDKDLQKMANLVLVTGRLGKMGKDQQILMYEMNKLIGKTGLIDKVLIIRHIDYQQEGGEIYRIVADSKGVFVNPALHEPFGITLIEAAAVGVPLVATNNGGPIDIIKKCKNGLLVNPIDTKQIAASIKNILKNKRLWNKFSKKGKLNVRKYYTWESAANMEYSIFKKIILGSRDKK